MFFERNYRIPLRSVLLFTGDTIGLSISIALAAFIRLGLDGGLHYVLSNQGALGFSLFVFLLVFYICGMYERQTMASNRGLAIPSAISVMIGLVIMMIIFYAKFDLIIGRGVLFLAAFFSFLSVLGLRQLYRATAGYSVFTKNALVVGEGRDAANIIKLINASEDPGCRIFGVVTHTKGTPGDLLENVPILGNISKLKHFVAHYRVETLIVATSMTREQALLKVLRPLRYGGVEILDYASFYEQIAQEIPLDHIDDEWLMHAAMNSSRIHIRKLKRIMDIATAVIGLILSAPICLITAICIRIDSPGGILFRQVRAGLDGAPYTLMKFRTMRTDAEANGTAVWAGKNDVRVTRVGTFLRKSRIDEVPQLINVLRGEMSLVGPRPERPEFIQSLAEAIPFYQERLLVPPGITGWAQVKAPYAASIKAARRKLQFDLYYIKHMSMVLDILILLRTFRTIIVGLRHSEDDETAADNSAAQLTVLPNTKAEPTAGSKTA